MKLLTLTFALLLPLMGQKHELGLMLGNLRGADNPNLSSGTVLQANYGVRVASVGPAKFFAGVNFLANAQRKITTTNLAVIRDLASAYITPELKVKLGEQRVQPFAFIGAGLAIYEHSLLTIGGTPNPGPRTSNTGAFTYGAGVDIGIIRWLAVRGEFRDTLTGAPSYNVLTGKQHNASITGGVVLRWGK